MHVVRTFPYTIYMKHEKIPKSEKLEERFPNYDIEQHERKRVENPQKIAKKYGIEVDEYGEFFEIPQYDESGKEIRRDKIPTWDKIHLEEEEGSLSSNTFVPVELAIQAIKKYPELGLREGAAKIEEEHEKQKK